MHTNQSLNNSGWTRYMSFLGYLGKVTRSFYKQVSEEKANLEKGGVKTT